MEDEGIWQTERSLWTGGADHYREVVAQDCLMVLPRKPFVVRGAAAIEAVAHTPRWSAVEFSDKRLVRPQAGLVVIAYHARAHGDANRSYAAWCTSTYRRIDGAGWRVIQHHQTPEVLP